MIDALLEVLERCRWVFALFFLVCIFSLIPQLFKKELNWKQRLFRLLGVLVLILLILLLY